MALNSNAFVEGIDPTSTFGGYASVLLQLIRQALPSSTYGMILFDSATPDVTGANAWRKRCVWIDTTTLVAPVVKIYRDSGSPGWIKLVDTIPNSTITTAMIQDAAITLVKLSTAGGAANQVIRVNGTATAFEFVNFSSLFTSGVVPLSSLNAGSLPPPTTDWYVLTANGGSSVVTTFGLNALANQISPGTLVVTQMSGAASPTAKAQFATSTNASALATWRYFNAALDIDDEGINGSKIALSSIDVTKIISGTANGQVITMNGGNPVWMMPATISLTKFTSAEIVIPAAAGGAITPTPHGLGAAPPQFRCVLVCKTAQFGYAVGDEIDCMSTVIFNDGDSALVPWVNGTNCQLRRSNRVGPGLLYLPRADTGAADAITEANWRLKFYAWI